MQALRRMILWHVLAVAALLAVAIGTVFAVLGPERVWTLVAGPADQGPVNFLNLERRTRPNDALACPEGVCAARIDIVPPVFAADVRTLRTALARIVTSEPDMRLADADDLGPTERYVQRTPLMRFPDTIDIRFFERGEGRSTVAIYSRSQIGWSDRGVNRARIERFLERLRAEVPVAP